MNIYYIFKKELKSYFLSPVAYILLAVFSAVTGFFFFAMTSEFMNYTFRIDAGQAGVGTPSLNVNEMLVRPLFSTIGFISIFLLPLFTMRMFAGEKRSGTIQLILTSPLKSSHFILGKYLAALTVYCMMLAITFFDVSMYFIYSSAEWKPVLVGYGGLFLSGAAFISLGAFLSSLTKNQVSAAVATFGLLLFFWVISWMTDGLEQPYRGIFAYLSVYNHHQDMVKGVLDTKDLVYYGSVIFLGLLLTEKSIELFRWRHQ